MCKYKVANKIIHAFNAFSLIFPSSPALLISDSVRLSLRDLTVAIPLYDFVRVSICNYIVLIASENKSSGIVPAIEAGRVYI